MTSVMDAYAARGEVLGLDAAEDEDDSSAENGGVLHFDDVDVF